MDSFRRYDHRIGGTISGRLGFRYNVFDTSLEADYIGIDTLAVDNAVPEPSTLGTGVSGIVLLGLALRATARGKNSSATVAAP